MMDTTTQTDLLHKLETFGDPRETWKWPDANPDYVTTLGLTQEDVPQLITITLQRLEYRDWPEDEDDYSGYAPIHAWRALAQLRVVEAVPMFLDMLDPMDKNDDDWYLEEFPWAFGYIGPPAIEAVTAYLQNTNHLEYPRICVAHALEIIAKKHPEARTQAVSALSKQLEKVDANSEVLNAFLVGNLVELKATEAGAVIERAFAAECVDSYIYGNWYEIRKELDLQDTGIVPEHLAQPPQPLLPIPKPRDLLPGGMKEEKRIRKKQIKRRSKRKQQRQSRKQNRKRKR